MKNIFKFILTLGFFLTIPYYCIFAQVGINTTNSAPDASAGLDVNFNNKGLLPPRMTTTQRNTIASPAEGLIIYNTDEKALNVYNGMAWQSMTPPQPFYCGFTININHVVSGGVSPVNKTVAYGTVNGIPGELTKCWITRNLGATQQATIVSDATEASAGWYFQFNRKQGYQYTATRTPATTWISSINETSEWIASNDPCTIEIGAGWRIPTNTEWTNVSGISGGNWTNWTGPYTSLLKLHAAGSLSYIDGALYTRGSYGYYWSSSQYDAINGRYLTFYANSAGNYTLIKAAGCTVRCLKDGVP